MGWFGWLFCEQFVHILDLLFRSFYSPYLGCCGSCLTAYAVTFSVTNSMNKLNDKLCLFLFQLKVLAWLAWFGMMRLPCGCCCFMSSNNLFHFFCPPKAFLFTFFSDVQKEYCFQQLQLQILIIAIIVIIIIIMLLICSIDSVIFYGCLLNSYCHMSYQEEKRCYGAQPIILRPLTISI